MHPCIRQFPSDYFYEGCLTDGETINLSNMFKEYHLHPLFRPFVFFDLKNAYETKSEMGTSLKNVKEAQFCVLLIENWIKGFFSQKQVMLCSTFIHL
jgi:senataxin